MVVNPEPSATANIHIRVEYAVADGSGLTSAVATKRRAVSSSTHIDLAPHTTAAGTRRPGRNTAASR